MTVTISHASDIQSFLRDASGLGNTHGSARHKQIVLRILQESVKLIEELEISDDEFWAGVEYLNRLGAKNEAGLLVAGLGVEHFLDLLHDAKEESVGRVGGTPRTIEGPLYVAGAPLSEGLARMDDGSEDGQATSLFLSGRVIGLDGKPIAGALVDLWQADTKGNYSHFDKTQSEYNLRRRIVTDANGRYQAQSIVPSGYGCDPSARHKSVSTYWVVTVKGPAHIHFFISAPGFDHLTTQINLSNDAYLWDDFAYATREGLVGEVHFIDDAQQSQARGVAGRFAEMEFNFEMRPAANPQSEQRSKRPRALQEA